MEYGDASGTNLLDIRRKEWCTSIIDTIDKSLIDKLPRLQSSDIPIGPLSNKIANSLGLPKNLLVSSGGGDNMMGAIGTGNTSEGKVTVSLGTSGTVYAYSDNPIIDPKGEVAAFCDSTNSWLSLVCTMNVTVATETVRKLFNQDFLQLERNIENSKIGAGGLLFLPYLTGERTPNLPQSKGVLYGLTPNNYLVSNITRATIEGVTLGLNYGFNRMKKLGIQPKEIRLTGGGSNNKLWRKICADIFNSEVVCFKVSEGAALGAAIQALWCYQKQNYNYEKISSITDRLIKVDNSTRAIPTRRNVEQYRLIQTKHDNLRDKLFRES
jgi:sugar (pentulose or hexulose) kinase